MMYPFTHFSESKIPIKLYTFLSSPTIRNTKALVLLVSIKSKLSIIVSPNRPIAQEHERRFYLLNGPPGELNTLGHQFVKTQTIISENLALLFLETTI